MHRALLDMLICPYTKEEFTLERFAGDGDDTEFGLLHSAAAAFPVVAGIPILLPRTEEIVARLKLGQFREAVALAAMGKAPPRGFWRVAGWFEETSRLRRLGQRLGRWRQARWLREVVEALFPDDGTTLGARSLYHLAYSRFSIASREVFNYHYYRGGMPRHLVALR